MANNMYPLVTIGIPTYNRADSYLRQALESVVKQTYTNIENSTSAESGSLIISGGIGIKKDI